MAAVNLTDYVKTQIINQTEGVLWRNQGTLPTFAYRAEPGVGDEAFSLLLPAANEKLILDNAPDNFFPLINHTFIKVESGLDADIPTLYRRNGGILASYAAPHINFDGYKEIRNVPGIELMLWDAGTATITPATDGSVIALPGLRKFVEDYQAVASVHKTAHDAVNKGKEDMKNFLDGHRYLHKAADKFGPAFWEFVPANIKKDHDREVAKKEQLKKAPIEVNLDGLIAQATLSRLNIDATIH